MAGRDPRQRIDALFDQALDLAPGERSAFLDRETVGDPVLRAEVEALLRLVDAEVPGLDPDALRSGELYRAIAASREDGGEAEPDAIGLEVGQWRLQRRLGEGGMGTVYLAQRTQGGFQQAGALKRLHVALGSSEFLRRFEQERQILASLNHPAIARLLDGGRDADGRPFLVMEYVEGEPLDRHCDAARLDIGRRLALFTRVCEAVAHAHRHLVVHRDIKPSNIVVTADGEVKLLDFGIAKVLGDGGVPLSPALSAQGSTGQLTRTRTRVFTPEYAAPEQVAGRPVTTATDIYQLGLLLYELLTGQRAQVVADDSPLALERCVCEIEPPRPSQRIGREPAIADARRTQPGALRRRLRGDLDNIVLKALRKAPERRYESAAALIDDIDRWRQSRPVHARPERFSYRAGKFVRRHPFGVAASAAMLAMLVAYAVTVTRQAATIAHERDRAQAEATKARQVQALVLRLFEGADPSLSGGTRLSARELLDRGWEGIQGELGDQPGLRAELMDTVGEAYRQLGEYDRAQPLFEEALAIAQAGEDPEQHARALRAMGRLQRDRGNFEQAESLLRDALARYRQAVGEPHKEVADTLRELGYTLTESTNYPAAEQIHRDALEMRRELFGDEHPDVADSLDMLGTAIRNQGNYPAAEPLLSEALAIRRRLLPSTHPHLAYTMSDLAMLRKDLGEYDSAESLYRESMDLISRSHGERHPYLATVMNNLARLLHKQRRFDEAGVLLEKAIVIRREALGNDHQAVALSLHDLGQVHAEAGDVADARRYFEQALAIYPSDHPWRAATISSLGKLSSSENDLVEAERLYREALSGQRSHYGSDHDRTAHVQMQLGIVLHRQGRLDEAEAELRQALDIFRARLGPDHVRIAEAQVALGKLLSERGMGDEAVRLLREAARIRSAAYGDSDDRTLEATRALSRARD